MRYDTAHETGAVFVRAQAGIASARAYAGGAIDGIITCNRDCAAGRVRQAASALRRLRNTRMPAHASILLRRRAARIRERPVWNLDTVHKLSELLAAVAVIVSLVFVGVQVQQNTTAVQSSAAQSVHENFATWYASIQNDGVLIEITTRGMQDYGSLNATEKGQFIAVFMSFSSHTQNAFYKWQEGSLSPELWRGWELVSMNFFSTPGGKAFWSERSYMFADAFQEYIGSDLMQRDPHEKARPWGAFEIGTSPD